MRDYCLKKKLKKLKIKYNLFTKIKNLFKENM